MTARESCKKIGLAASGDTGGIPPALVASKITGALKAGGCEEEAREFARSFAASATRYLAKMDDQEPGSNG